MSLRSVLVIVLALTCGASAAWGVSRLGRRPPSAGKPETVPVVVATGQLSRGQMLTRQMVAVRPWPKGLVPAGAISRPEDVVQRAAVSLILTGEPICEGKLAPRDSGRGLAALVPAGMRAYTIQTSRVASNVAGFILPGNRVDVLLTLRGGSNDSTGGGSSTTLLQAVEILAVDQRLDAPAENRVDPKQLGSVTLLVTPDQAALLDLGQNMGTLTLSLRNPEDLAEARTQPATLDLLRFTQRRPAAGTGGSLGQGWASRPLKWTAAALAAALVGAGPSARDPAPRAAVETFEIWTLRGRHSGRLWVRSRELKSPDD